MDIFSLSPRSPVDVLSYSNFFRFSRNAPSFNIYNVVGAVLPLLFRIILTAASSNSKHVLNAQVSIRAPCCESNCLPLGHTNYRFRNLILLSLPGRKWFDCAECHREQETHPLKKTTEMVRFSHR